MLARARDLWNPVWDHRCRILRACKIACLMVNGWFWIAVWCELLERVHATSCVYMGYGWFWFAVCCDATDGYFLVRVLRTYATNIHTQHLRVKPVQETCKLHRIALYLEFLEFWIQEILKIFKYLKCWKFFNFLIFNKGSIENFTYLKCFETL